MVEGYTKFTVPEDFLRYGGPLFACCSLGLFCMCVYRLITARDRRSLRVVIVLCAVMLLLASAFWLDLYFDYPMWLYGIFEFWSVVFEISVLERLGSSWLTIYKRHISLCNQLSAYSKTIQRASLAASIAFQVTFACTYAILFTWQSRVLRTVCRCYFLAVELLYFFPYMIYSAFKLNSVIKLYLDPDYSRKVRNIVIVGAVCIPIRDAILTYFTVRSGRDIDMLDDDGYDWLTILLFSLSEMLSIGCMVVIITVLFRRNPSRSYSLLNNQSMSEGKQSASESCKLGWLISKEFSANISDANKN